MTISCSCGQVLAAGKCVPICQPGQTLCGCSICCGADKVCNPVTLTCELPIN